LVWFELPALSFGPHLLGAQFSVKGLSLVGPLSGWAFAQVAAKHNATVATGRTANFLIDLVSI
jgi:hypothetical protein